MDAVLVGREIVLCDGTNESNLRLHESETQSGMNSAINQSIRSQVLFGLYSCMAMASALVCGPRSFS